MLRCRYLRIAGDLAECLQPSLATTQAESRAAYNLSDTCFSIVAGSAITVVLMIQLLKAVLGGNVVAGQRSLVRGEEGWSIRAYRWQRRGPSVDSAALRFGEDDAWRELG